MRCEAPLRNGGLTVFTRVALYKARPGTQQAHDMAVGAGHDVIAAQPGFLGSLLGRSHEDESQYVEVIQWESAAHAKAAFSVASSHQAVRAWIDQVDLPSVQSWEMRTLGVISRQERSLGDSAVGTWLLVRWRTQEDVKSLEHTRNELLMHHEAFAPVSGYRGALVLQEIQGEDRMELIAWPSAELAQRSVAQILGSGDPLVAQHLSDCAPGSSLHYIDPIVRA